MKAIVIEAPGRTPPALRELPDPVPGHGEVLVRIRAVSLNYRDRLIAEGGYGSRQKRSELVPLSDGAGEIVALGPGVEGWRVGDRVAGCFYPNWTSGSPTEAKVRGDLGSVVDGVACELRAFAASGIVRLPDALDFVAAAALPCAAVTAWNAVRVLGGIGPEHTVLTIGSGGVALFAVQIAKLAGARVIALSSSADKLERLRRLGADAAVSYVDDPGWGKTARELTGGRGVDLVVETGGGGTLRQSMRAVRQGGTIAVIGVVAGPVYELNLPLLMMSHTRLVGISVGSRDDFVELLAALAAHAVRPVIDRVFALRDFAEALGVLGLGRHFGKICLEV